MKRDKDRIFVFGASGHAKVVIDIIERQGLYQISFLVDDDHHLKDTYVYGYRVIGGKTQLLASDIRHGIVAIGCNSARSRVADWLGSNGYSLVTAIHPSAKIGRGVTFGNGTVVMAGAVINSDAALGSNVIVNTRAGIDHDCLLGNFVHIAPGTTLCGTVRVGDGTLIGAGATVIPNITIGSNVIVAAGAVVVKEVPDEVTVMGTPARIFAR